MKTAAAPLVGLILLAASAAAQPGISGQYNFVTLDFPNSPVSYPLGINKQGAIAGFYVDAKGVQRGYLWVKGKFTVIEHPDAPLVPGGGSGAGGINDLGQIVGTYKDKDGFQHGYLRTTTGACEEGDLSCTVHFVNVDVPGAAQTKGIPFEFGTGLGTNAIGLNNNGNIVGLYATKGLYSNGYILSHSLYGHIDNPASTHSAGLGTKLFGINDNGAVAGDYIEQAHPNAPAITHGFLLDNGHFTPLDVPGSPQGGFGTQVNGINGVKTIVGVFSSPDGNGHGLVWRAGTFYTLDFPGALFSELHCINIDGVITGAYSTDPKGELIHGFVAYPKPH
jgi:uncharacterized membrane protein